MRYVDQLEELKKELEVETEDTVRFGETEINRGQLQKLRGITIRAKKSIYGMGGTLSSANGIFLGALNGKNIVEVAGIYSEDIINPKLDWEGWASNLLQPPKFVVGADCFLDSEPIGGLPLPLFRSLNSILRTAYYDKLHLTLLPYGSGKLERLGFLPHVRIYEGNKMIRFRESVFSTDGKWVKYVYGIRL